MPKVEKEFVELLEQSEQLILVTEVVVRQRLVKLVVQE
jgi:hypothetical protein